jgi:hypothetical protein
MSRRAHAKELPLGVSKGAHVEVIAKKMKLVVRASNGSRLNVSEANCRKGATAVTTYIQCFSGSTIAAFLLTGELNGAANTLTAQEVILI